MLVESSDNGVLSMGWNSVRTTSCAHLQTGAYKTASETEHRLNPKPRFVRPALSLVTETVSATVGLFKTFHAGAPVSVAVARALENWVEGVRRATEYPPTERHSRSPIFSPFDEKPLSFPPIEQALD